eukprot:CAMPEP_0117451964 /NCGR_PEP_ID=MMETSP0759-20121206/9315_1 /TAXON_ID=63605 /ORGANISM="Percolomonas cosmopolitus, Strain WS" /LENGTH=153 /DNA_ID=CAMNT_0005244653 /DNA_START=49 /DNA_END=506 /DNA_ORIENTATION=+
MCRSFRKKDLYWKCDSPHENTSFSPIIGNCYNGTFRFRELFESQMGDAEWFIVPAYESDEWDDKTPPDHFFLLLKYRSQQEILLYPSYNSFEAILTFDDTLQQVHVIQFHTLFGQLKELLQEESLSQLAKTQENRFFRPKYQDGVIEIGLEVG